MFSVSRPRVDIDAHLLAMCRSESATHNGEATRIEERICELAEGTLEDLREEQLERFEIAGLFREVLALVRIGFIRNSGLSADALKRLKAVEDEACAIYRERTRDKERLVILKCCSKSYRFLISHCKVITNIA